MKSTSLLFALASLLLAAGCDQESAKSVTTDAGPDVDVETVSEAVNDATETATEQAAGFVSVPLIDPNTATAEAIAEIPGIDASLAQEIIAGRPYSTPSALNTVLEESLDENALAAIYRVMFVKVDLNTGDNADYRLIPSSLSPKHLAHEFEEYRPYTSIEQFGREMSKYVSAEEVAFLKRYVLISE